MSINKAKVVSGLLGLGSGGGELQKLTIYYEQSGRAGKGSIEALFNPSEISMTRSADWEQQLTVGQNSASVEQEFRSVRAETFSIELFFDTYESRSNAMTGARAAATFLPASQIPGREASDVRQYTDQIARLIEVDTELHRPPLCDLRWGVFDIFTGVLTTLGQRFTLFLDDGTPVRATLTCDFVEVGTQAQARATELHSSDVVKTRQVRRYDTLQSLAADEYGDPALWRPIATANGIVNPRDLRPGTMLTIPKLQP
jgi:nucleoid-associated protein YgaU